MMNAQLKSVEDDAPVSTPSPTSAVWPRRTSSFPPDPRQGSNYAELDGGQGRGVFFRPQRYQRDDLGPIRPIVRVVFRSATDSSEIGAAYASHQCPLHDVSQNGVALEFPPGL